MQLGDLVVHNTCELKSLHKSIKCNSLEILPAQYSFKLPMQKADRFYEGSKIILPNRSDALNPVSIMQHYVNSRKTKFRYNPLLWIRLDRSPPTHSWFIRRLNTLFPDKSIASHSLRSGGATAYAISGMSDNQIQALGRWLSDVFKVYICKNPILLHALMLGDRSPLS
jgi:hypothetical protein